MTLSEQDFRELLRERSAVVPPGADHVGAVQDRVRRRRRREIAALSAGLVVALVATVGLVVPRLGDGTTPTPPAGSSTPSITAPPVTMVTGSATIRGIEMRTSGPDVVGTAPVIVTVTVTNTTSATWHGDVSVGVSRALPVAGAVDNLLFPPAGTPARGGMSVLLPDGTSSLNGAVGPDMVLAPGASRELSFTLQRDPHLAAHGPNHGWVPWLHTAGSPDGENWGDPATFPLVGFAPSESDSPCASFNVTSATANPAGAFELTSAYTTTAGADRVAHWTEVPGLPGSFMPRVEGTDAYDYTVVEGLGADGVVAPAMFGNRDPDQPASTQSAGTFVSYAGVKPYNVDFTGTCEPSGSIETGAFYTWSHDTQGILDCTVVPPPDSLGHLAAGYCPAGTAARRSA